MVVVVTVSEHTNKSGRVTSVLGVMKKTFVDLNSVSNPPRSFYFSIFTIFIGIRGASGSL